MYLWAVCRRWVRGWAVVRLWIGMCEWCCRVLVIIGRMGRGRWRARCWRGRQCNGRFWWWLDWSKPVVTSQASNHVYIYVGIATKDDGRKRKETTCTCTCTWTKWQEERVNTAIKTVTLLHLTGSGRDSFITSPPHPIHRCKVHVRWYSSHLFVAMQHTTSLSTQVHHTSHRTSLRLCLNIDDPPS
jgi:hypothetical protein